MSLPLRASGACVLLVLVILAAGCGQFEITGAPDPCPGQERLSSEQAQRCWKTQTTTLTTEYRPPDPAGGGRLREAPLPIAGRPLRQAVALDYSGSMYGGYDDKEPGEPPCGWHFDGNRHVRNGPYYWEMPEFAELLGDGPLGALTGAEPVHPVVFNRVVTVLGAGGFFSTFDEGAGRFSSPLPSPVQGRAAVLAALTATGLGTLPPNPAKAPFGDPRQTRLDDVLTAASVLFESFEERDGILWIVTDNIIEQAPAGDAEVKRDAQYNQQFYQTLKDDPRWQVIHAWPIHQARWMCGSTLMVYGLYYSSRERIGQRNYNELCHGAGAQLAHERQIEAFRRYAHSASPSPGLPFKLKPHDIDVVKLSFVGQVRCDAVKVGMPGQCRARIEVVNLLYHRQIDAAEIVLSNGRCDPWGPRRSGYLQPVRIAAPFCAGTITKTLALPRSILPGRPERLDILFESPPVETVRTTFADHLESSNFERFLMLGSMGIRIRDLKTSMVIRPEALQNVYGVESWPSLFSNASTDNLQTTICLPLSVHNPSFLTSFLLVGLIFVLVLLILAVLWLLASRFRSVLIDGVEQGRFRLRRIGSQPLEHNGRRIGRVKLSLNGSPKLWGVGGYRIRKQVNHWIGEDPATGDKVTIEVVTKYRKASRKPSDGTF